MIQVHNINYSYNDNLILDNINLNLCSGKIIAFIGPNGSGKSTLLSLMSRIKKLRTGSVLFDDLDITTTKSSSIAKKIAILSQGYASRSNLKVIDLLTFGRYPYHKGEPKQEDFDVIEESINLFDLSAYKERYLDELSGGEQQRVLVAMIFCQSTDYLLLDEPLNNLDIFHAQKLMQNISSVVKKYKKTVFIVLHDINQAITYADHIIAIKNGRILFNGETNTVITKDNIKQLFNIDCEIISHNNKKYIIT